MGVSTILGFIILAILAFLGYWFFLKEKGETVASESTKPTEEVLGIYQPVLKMFLEVKLSHPDDIVENALEALCQRAIHLEDKVNSGAFPVAELIKVEANRIVGKHFVELTQKFIKAGGADKDGYLAVIGETTTYIDEIIQKIEDGAGREYVRKQKFMNIRLGDEY